jgi:spermidine/putrescine transport system permease protein
VLAFPLSLFIAQSGARKNLYLSLVILPFWTSFLIRLYAWMFLLRDTGLIDTTLQSLGLIREPLPMLYNSGAVLLGLVYGFLPFAVLPIYATLERLDKSLLEAAADLGASPLAVLTRVTLPLTAPGVGAAAILVFVPCLGTYITSDLLGGSKTILIGNLVQNQFTTARDWPFGAAVSIVLMIVALLFMFGARRRGEELL